MALDPQRLKELFLRAAEIESPAERAAYLERECGNDAELRRKLEALLHAHDDSDSFLAPGPTSDPTPTGDEQPHAESSDAAGDVIGPYKLLQKLGEGGMGAVWVAEQHQPVKRRVALKLIKPGMDSTQVLRRFEAERQALALMDHTSIAKVFDAGTTTQGRPYFVMELVKGVPITKYCDELNLPIRERLTLFVPVCQAIQHAHQKGIIHRDIKPSNVLVCLQDGKPVPKIIDFGIAKATSQRLTDASLYTEVGQVIGTLEYMSPEQAELSALDIDTRADVYALGAMLYELLTGTTPLDRRRLKQAALMEVLRLIKEQEPPRPSTRLSESKDSLPSIAAHRHTEPARLTKEVRGELDWIVMKCLEKDRTRRYETANALARDVERYLTDEPVEACPPSRTYRLGKFARKYRAALSAAAAFVLLLAIAAVVSVALAVRARQAEALAETRLEEVSKEKARADEESRIAAAVNGFLQKQLLGQADIGNQPLTAGGATERNPNVTVRELLDRAAREIEGQFADQPVTEAAIRFTIGDAYRALGRYPEAQQHLERAVQLYTAKLGADHPDTLTSKITVAHLYWDQGQYAKAEPLLKEALQARTAKLGADHPDTLLSKNNLAALYHAQVRYAKAEPLYEEALQGQTAKLGADHPNTLSSKNNLGRLYRAQGQYAKAEPLLKEALQARTAKLGADHPLTLLSKNNLAGLYEEQGQYAKAEPLYKEALKGRAAKLGADHPDTLDSKNSLATLYLAQGQYAKAEPFLKEALEGQTVKLGADHPHTLISKNNLAVLYNRQGQYAKAEPLYKEVLESRAAKLGADHPDTLLSKNNLAMLYLAQSQYAKAEPLLKEVLQGFTAKLDADHPYTLTSKNNLAGLYQAQGQYAKAEALLRELLASWEHKAGADSLPYAGQLAVLARNLLLQHKADDAESILRQCLTIRQNKQPDDWTTFNTQSMLGGALLSQKKYTDAEPLLRQGYEGMKQRETTIPAPFKAQRLSEALQRLVQLYEATGNKDEAAKRRKELEEVKKAAPKTEVKP
jgi:serine/threonine protein kinase/tetratricopeptide (TPR) repeat protein